MEQPRTQTKVAMYYGAYYGLLTAVIMLLFYFIEFDVRSKLPQYLGYLVQIIIIVLGIKSYRDSDLGGFIGYGRSLGTGTLISIFGGVITGAFTLLFFTYIAPEMPQKILDMTQQQMAEQGMPDDQIEMMMSYTKKFMTPGWLFFFSILGSAIVGFILSLIISVFMKKEQNNPFQENVA